MTAMLKRKIQDLTICFTYNFSCLHSEEHSMRAFRRNYQICEEIGRGGFGVVYKAFRVADGRPVAVKYVEHRHVRQWTMYDEESSRGRHQMIPAEISHLLECADVEGVVRLVDWFASSKGFMIVMERPSNFMDLFDVVGTYGRLDEQIARQIFTQVTTAVVQLYRRHSIVHRDIKDENVIVDMETGEVRLVDFGAADYLERAKHREFQGTKSYCAPEWFKRRCYLPLESTVWSLGILLYILLTGDSPFKNEIQICVGRPRFPDYVSEESQAFIKQCLNPSPERRPHIEELLDHEWFQRNAEAAAQQKQKCQKSLILAQYGQPFHAILHRRSIKRRRRCDNASEADFATEERRVAGRDGTASASLSSSASPSASSEEAECSYRQEMATPILIPQHVLDAAAASAFAKAASEGEQILKSIVEKDANAENMASIAVAEDRFSFQKTMRSEWTSQAADAGMDSSSGFETAGGEEESGSGAADRTEHRKSAWQKGANAWNSSQDAYDSAQSSSYLERYGASRKRLPPRQASSSSAAYASAWDSTADGVSAFFYDAESGIENSQAGSRRDGDASQDDEEDEDATTVRGGTVVPVGDTDDEQTLFVDGRCTNDDGGASKITKRCAVRPLPKSKTLSPPTLGGRRQVRHTPTSTLRHRCVKRRQSLYPKQRSACVTHSASRYSMLAKFDYEDSSSTNTDDDSARQDRSSHSARFLRPAANDHKRNGRLPPRHGSLRLPSHHSYRNRGLQRTPTISTTSSSSLESLLNDDDLILGLESIDKARPATAIPAVRKNTTGSSVARSFSLLRLFSRQKRD